MDKIKFIDLFAGLGGIRIGFENAVHKYHMEAECVFTSEIKKHAVLAYQNHFGGEVCGDITKIETILDFDVLLAGFPCQPFSNAGNRMGFADTRGTMFFEIERILQRKIREGHPASMFLLENVEGLVSHDGGRTLEVILNRLNELGYDVSWKVLDAWDFGVAQMRKRIYIVGSMIGNVSMEGFAKTHAVFKDVMENGLPVEDTAFTRALLSCYNPKEIEGKSIKDKRGGEDNIHSCDIGIRGKITDEQKRLMNALMRERRKKKWAKEIGIPWMDGMPLTEDQIKTFFYSDNLFYMLCDLVDKKYLSYEHPKTLQDGKRVPDTSKPKGYNIVSGRLSFEFSKILDPNKPVHTLTATDVQSVGVVDGEGIRHLGIREVQRLFGYDPDTYSLAMLKRKESLDLLGNTVCIPVIDAVSDRMVAMLHEKFGGAI